MNIDYTRNQLLEVCYKLLALKEGKLERNFSEVVGFVIGPENRADIVCSLLEDIVRLKKGEATHHHIFIGKDSSDSDLTRVLKDTNWYDLVGDNGEKRQVLGLKIEEAFFGDQKKPKNKSHRSKYVIKEDDFASVIDSVIDLSMFNSFGVRELFYEKISRVYNQADTKKYEYPPLFEKLSSVFELTEIQKKILFFYFLYEVVEKFESFVDYTPLDYSKRAKASSAFAKLFGISTSKVKRELRSSSKLSQAMLIEIDDNSISLSDHISDFLQNDDEDSDIFSFFFEKANYEDSLDIKNHRLSKNEIDALKYLVKCDEGANFLLYGAPGTGKTEFTKSIGKKLGLDVYKIKTHDADSDDMVKTKKSALIAAKSMLNNKSLLVVDEAEEILESGSNIFYKDKSDHKAWLNTYMEDHGINIVWITNDMTMHPSTKRRFDLSICFESFSRTQRLAALSNIQGKSGMDLFNEEELFDLAREYTLDPGALNLAFRKMGALADERVNKKNVVLTLLDSQMKLIKGRSVKEKPIESFYNPDFINTSINEDEIMSAIKSFYQGTGSIHNLCVLFEGVPGTGKTEYAKYISEELEKNMSIKRASDILSSFWGGTEKQIAEMFSLAEKDGDILFLDECDSLFKPRGNAEYSWMVSETNELLTQMEKFKGVLICATNFVENIDRAALRRFHLKVKFDDLKVDKLADVYMTFFSGLVSKKLSSLENSALESIRNLNPGDFKAVYNGILFKKNISHEEIISRLRDEVSYKKKRNKIGLTGVK